MSDDRADRLSQQIPLKFRKISALLHAIFALPMGLNIGFYLWLVFIGSRDLSSYTIALVTILFYLLCVSLPLVVVLPIMSWAMWRVTREIDPVVDRAGRDVLNYAISNLISILCLTVTIVVISGFLFKMKYFLEVSLATLLLSVAAFAMTSTVAGVFALRGYRFKNRLIHPFIKDR